MNNSNYSNNLNNSNNYNSNLNNSNNYNNNLNNSRNNTGKKWFIILLIGSVIIAVILFFTYITNFKNTDMSNDNHNQNISENDEIDTNFSQDDNDNINVDDNITDKTALIIVKNIMNKYYNEVFHKHQNIYCGGYDRSDIIQVDSYDYYKSSKYNSLNSLKKYLNTYMSSDLIDSMLDINDLPNYEDVPNYQEKDGKLYCLVLKDGYNWELSYNHDESVFEVIDFDENNISAKATVYPYYDGMSNAYPTYAKFKFQKIDGKWLLTQYKEVYL